MKIALVYILLFATLLPTVSPWGTIAYYHANKDYIARVLCENRDKPQLNCDGKCYLAKKLKAQQDKQDKETTERVQNAPILHLFCADYLQFTFPPIRETRQESVAFAYLLTVYSAPLAPVFQPPGLGC
jgi:hypothetical protein